MKKIVIIVSGPPSSGSSTIAKEIAEKLGLDYYSPGKVFKSHTKGKESKAAIDVWKTELGTSKELHRSLEDEQIGFAKKGNVVICGKLSIHFLKKFSDFKIWLDVPLNVRARRTANRDGISFEEARKHIVEREKFERTEWKRIYGFDYFEQKNDADFVVETSNLTVEETVTKILEHIKKR
jgi:cytidylate kinase